MDGASRMEDQWRAAATWWADEGSSDPVYDETVMPLLHELVGETRPGDVVLDVGCGEGSVSRGMGPGDVIGIDVTHELLLLARRVMPVVRGRLPHCEWIRPGSVSGAYAVLVIEHLVDLDTFFTAMAAVVGHGGFLVVIANHPAYTAPGAGPLIDPADGEVLWRWGPYFSLGVSDEPAGDARVTFHHRPLGVLLSTAAAAGWSLERFVEVPLGPVAIGRHPGYEGQEHMPRLFGARWERLAR